jgi:poly-gamma-glutamate capsule biosynthesis protein CapA/YwtB (metallophosphatase superfamily)
MERPPALVSLASAVVLVAGLLLILRAGTGRPAAADAAAPPLRVTTTLPSWRAPGTRLLVTGFGASHERVVLRANGRLVGTETAGRFGRFAFHVRVPEAGRYRLRVHGEQRSRTVGVLRVRPVVLDAVGDITFGEQVGPALAARGADYPWTYVARTLRAADLTTGNLETSVSTRGTAAVKEYTFRGGPAALPPLARLAGFDVLTLANNHTVDFGREALLDTLRNVHATGIETIGAGANALQARRPAVLERGGLRIALLGYSDVNPAGFTATSTSPGTAAAEVAAITADVHAALRRADVAVCFFHWGLELHATPTSRQQLLAAACLNAGAKLVLGAHPHVLGGLSRPAARSLVAWTLGNFVFPSSGVNARTAILRVDLDATGVRDGRLLPVAIHGFQPRLVG